MTTTPTQVLALPWISTHRRRVAGAAGIPTLSPPVQAGETIVNEVDAGGLIEYYGVGNDGNGNATSVVPAAGQGFIDARAQVAAATSVKFGRRVAADSAWIIAASDVSTEIPALTISRTYTLPAAASVPVGQPYVVYDGSGTLGPTKRVIVQAAGTDTISSAGIGAIGSTKVLMATPWRRLTFISNGTSWVATATPYRGPVYVTPFDFGAVGDGSVDDAPAIQAAWNFLVATQAGPLFEGSGLLDLCGGMFALGSAITTSGAPYAMTIANGSLIPFGAFAGNFIDFTGSTATTNLRFSNLSLNGFVQASVGIKLGPKTQGTWVSECIFSGFTRAALEDTTPTAATELRLINNTVQGGKNANVGFGFIVNGNDGHAIGNIFRNVNCGIFLASNGAWLFALNHIYSYSVSVPIPLLYLKSGYQIQIHDNYLDEGYIYICNPSGATVHDNKFLTAGPNNMTMTLPTLSTAAGSLPALNGATVAFRPIVLAPQTANYDMFAFSVADNSFINLFATPNFNPVYVDPANGSIGPCQNTIMKDNIFSGYNFMSTEPWTRATANGSTSLTIDFGAKLPWSTPTYVMFYTLEAAGAVNSVAVSGTAATLTTAAAYTGAFSMRVTVNNDGN